MAVATLFESFRVAANKPFCDDPAGRAWQRTLGRLMDDSFERVYAARLARFPSDVPTDGLQYIASERQVEQAIGESEANYRGVLKRAWELWRIAGSQDVHKFNLARMGCLSVTIKRRHDLSGVPAHPNPYINAFARDVWAQFDVILQQPMPWNLRVWGTDPPWGVGVWGPTNMTMAQTSQLRRLLRTFRAAHDTPMYVWMYFGGGRLWGIGFWGEGVWKGGSGPLIRFVVGETHWEQRGLVPLGTVTP